MKRIVLPIFVVLLTCLVPYMACGSNGLKELHEIAKEVEKLQLGFGDYVLGSKVNAEQKKQAGKNNIEKTLPGTYKFVDGEVFVVAKSDDDLILGIYKDYPVATREDTKQLVGDLMMRFEEPTTMAHDKVIYWAFNQNGKIKEDEYDFSKKTGETDMIATVKFQSSERIFPDRRKGDVVEKGAEKAEQANDPDKESALYVIISSNPMSKLFLALNEK